MLLHKCHFHFDKNTKGIILTAAVVFDTKIR
jgi:hypothetical protein